MTENRTERLKVLFQQHGPIIRSSLLKTAKFCSKDVTSLVHSGQLIKVRTGYYALPETFQAMSDLEVVASIIPCGVISLLSAARYHGLLKSIPSSIEIAIPSKNRVPILPKHPTVSVSKSNSEIYMLGVQNKESPYCKINVYNKERTICDLFRQRQKVGGGLALNALKAYMLDDTKDVELLYEYADRLQIKSILLPYVEALS